MVVTLLPVHVAAHGVTFQEMYILVSLTLPISKFLQKLGTISDRHLLLKRSEELDHVSACSVSQ